MRSFRRALALVGALIASPACATIGTPVDLGAAEQATGTRTTFALTTGSACASGSTVVVLETTDNIAPATGVSDGTAYAGMTASSQTSTGSVQLWWRTLASTLASGSTITATYSGTSGPRTAHALCVSGLAASPVDIAGVGAKDASTTSPTISTGTLAQSNELVIGYTIVLGSTATFTGPSGWTMLTSETASSTYKAYWGYEIVAATGSVAFAPTLSISATSNIAVSTLKDVNPGGGGSSSSGARRALLGVGL